MNVRTWGKRIAAALLAAVWAAALPSQAFAAASPGAGGLSVLTDELGNTALYGYREETNQLDWVQGPEDTAGTRTNYRYDAQQRLTALEKAVSGLEGGLTAIANRYGYEAGQLVSLFHSNTADSSTEYRLVRDEDGRLTEVQVGGRTLVSYRYADGQDEPAETVYGNGSLLSRSYDAEGRLTASRWDGDARTETRYTYDAAGRVTSAVQGPAGRETRSQYDDAGRLTAQEQTEGGQACAVRWEYDAEGRLARVTETQDGESRSTEFRYDTEGRLAAVDFGAASAVYQYDAEGRLTGQELLYQGRPAAARTVEYLPAADGTASSRVSVWRSGDREFRYTYDGRGNILTVSEGGLTTSYTYDEAGQLVREDNQRAGRTWVWAYDAGGNIRRRAEYPYTEGALGEPEQTAAYDYGDSQWGDLLTGYEGRALETDGAGNLLTDGVWSYRWECGRQLAGMSDGSRTLAFGYDADGRRVQKTADGVVWRYGYQGDKLTYLSNGTDTLRFGYDGEGAAVLEWNGAVYFFLRDRQGNIVGLADTAGETVVEYTYNAWGVPLAVTGRLADTLGQLNPLRYRGYCYDAETGLYYLTSRYYHPALGRFISADEVVAGPGSALLGGNLFAYGLNDPVNTSDPAGNWPRWITAGFAALSALTALRQQSLRAALTALAATGVYRLQVVHFDVREALNIDIPLTREEAIAAGWLGPDTNPVGPSALLHQFTSTVFGENVKYVSPDGCREAIYDGWGKLIADVRDIGTYNFAPSGTLWGDIRHFFVDMLPWAVFGNDDGDPGPLIDGLIRLFQ